MLNRSFGPFIVRSILSFCHNKSGSRAFFSLKHFKVKHMLKCKIRFLCGGLFSLRKHSDLPILLDSLLVVLEFCVNIFSFLIKILLKLGLVSLKHSIFSQHTP